MEERKKIDEREKMQRQNEEAMQAREDVKFIIF